MDTGVLVALVALASALLTKLFDWWRGRNKDTAEVDHMRAATERTHIESSNDIVASFQKLLDERTDFFNDQLAAVKGENAAAVARVDELEHRLGRVEAELSTERDARIAAEARADEVKAELATARRLHDESEQYVEVLVSSHVHHGLEVPIRPTPTGDTP